jgi:hypothetical protein
MSSSALRRLTMPHSERYLFKRIDPSDIFYPVLKSPWPEVLKNISAPIQCQFNAISMPIQ